MSIRNEIYEEGYQDGYEKGYDVGKASAEADEALKEYEAGQCDLWEVVRKIILPPEEGGIDVETIKDIFGYSSDITTPFSGLVGIDFIFKKYTPQEVINIINEYEANKIEVGEEVENITDDLQGMKLLVTQVTSNGKYFDGIDSEGTAFPNQKVKEYTKTGRYFNIKNIFDKMKKEGCSFEW